MEDEDDACRVCGFDIGGGWDGAQPLYIICACCGAESGLEDSPTTSAHAYLRLWISAGCPWFDEAMRPPHWRLVDQLRAARMDEATDVALTATDVPEPPARRRWGRRRTHPFAVTPWFLRQPLR